MTVFLLLVIVLLLTMTRVERSNAIADFIRRLFSILFWTVAIVYHVLPFFAYTASEPDITRRPNIFIAFLMIWVLPLPAAWKAYFEHRREKLTAEGKTGTIPWGLAIAYHLSPILVFWVFKPSTQDGAAVFILFLALWAVPLLAGWKKYLDERKKSDGSSTFDLER